MNIRRQSGIFHFEEGFFSKGAQVISKSYHEVLLIMNFLQTEPQVNDMNKNFMICITLLIKIR